MADVSGCTRCALATTRSHVVIYRGSLRPRLLFVGEAPGAEEDRAGIPFVGRAGRKLDEAIAQLPVPPDGFGIVNLLKCRPPANRFDRAAEKVCRPFLDRQMALLRPQLFVTLGAHAFRTFVGPDRGLMEAAGATVQVDGRTIFPLIHPAATFRSTRFARRWDHDVGVLSHELPALLRESL